MNFTKKVLKDNIIYITALLVAAAIFVGCAVVLIDRFMPPAQNLNQYKTPVVQQTKPQEFKPNVTPQNPIMFESLQNFNPDICGWITVDGTLVDYPILRSGPDKEEQFYLTHDYSGVEQRYGSIFIERMNVEDFSDSNTVIYGHNMLSGAMFGQLKKFRSQEFFNENRYIHIYAPKKIYKYEIYAAYVTDDRHILRSYNFYMQSGYKRFIDDVMKEDNIAVTRKKDGEITVNDKIITLSTCTSNEEERYIVIAKLIQTTDTL